LKAIGLKNDSEHIRKHGDAERVEEKKMKQSTNLARTTFETSRLLEFFTEKELQMQIGHPKAAWPIALAKKLIDNALDVCETANVAPGDRSCCRKGFHRCA
jgi:hypothetical protein